MRIRHTVLAAVGALTLAVSGCSSGAGTGSTQGDSATTQGAAAEGFPATVATKFGDVTIDDKPQRVVALGWGDAETALALGVQPVGASDWLDFGGEGVGPWMAGKYTNPPQLIETLEPSYEAIAALQPDLILDVKSSGDAQRHQRLASIAPTVGVPEGGDNYLTPADDQMTMIATALGEPETGKQLIAEVDQAFEQAAAAHPGWKGKTFTAATKTADGWGAYVGGSDRVTFMQNLGFTQNPTIAAMQPDATGFSTSLSAENLDSIDADVVVAFPIFVPTAQLTGDPAFAAVPAVQQNRAVIIDGDLAQAYSLGTTTATQYAIGQLVPKLEQAIGS